jgi:hypothetical protein
MRWYAYSIRPVLEAFLQIELPAADRLLLRMPGDHCLGARAARRGADANDVGQRRLRVRIAGEIPVQHLARGLHQGFHLQRLRAFLLHALRRTEFERAQAAPPHVGEAVEGGDFAFRHAAPRHPRVDQRIPEIVRQRVRQQPRQMLERLAERRKREHRIAGRQRHHQRRELDAQPAPARIVFEGIAAERRIRRGRADGPIPDADLDDRHAHDDGDGDDGCRGSGGSCSVRRFRTRCGTAPAERRSAIGLTRVSGTSAPKGSGTPKARSTRNSVSTVLRPSFSRFPSVRSEIPALAAVSSCERGLFTRNARMLLPTPCSISSTVL